MGVIVWDQSYSVNVQEIDNQHKYFFETLNMLYDAVNTMKTKEMIGEVFKRLINYANFHFETEEKYFDTFKYEGAEEHRHAHNNFREKLGDMYKSFGQDSKTLSINLVDFLEDWLVQHINSMDKKYTECFNQHGLV